MTPPDVSRLVAVEVAIAWGPDARPRVLLQLEDGWTLMDADGARAVASLLAAAADELADLTLS